MSKKAIPLLKKRFHKLGFTPELVEVTLKYIRDTAPIIIHFNLGRDLKFFLKDTHYRNGFETRVTDGHWTVRE